MSHAAHITYKCAGTNTPVGSKYNIFSRLLRLMAIINIKHTTTLSFRFSPAYYKVSR